MQEKETCMEDYASALPMFSNLNTQIQSLASE